MIIFKKGNIFDSECQTLVNTVNCEGVMGRGLALQFKERYSDMFIKYKEACINHELLYGGDIWIYDYVDLYNHKKILCFATKENWRNPSKIEWIERGLQYFFNNYKSLNITSIVWPKLGCANGKLDYETQVKPLMIKYLEPINIICEIYE